MKSLIRMSAVVVVAALLLAGFARAAVIVGTTGSDTLIGTPEDDTIYGLGGNDSLDVLAGGDVMYGGLGNDIYRVDSPADVVVEHANEGTDRVYASFSYVLPPNVEQLILQGTAAIDATGNELDNVIRGNAAANVIDGGPGADAMIDGGGDDTYIVDDVDDIVSEFPGGGTDTVYASVSYTLRANVENLTLTGTAAVNATGNSLPNELTGNSGNNVLDGGGVLGYAGADVLRGDSGDDTYVFHAGYGELIVVDVAGVDVLSLGAGITMATVVFSSLGSDLVLEFTGSPLDRVTIRGQTGMTPIESLRFADGTELSLVARPPVANAGPDQSVHVGSSVTLDGSASSDPGMLALTFAWSFAAVPEGSGATLSDPSAVTPTFTADREGTYVLSLIVTNSAGLSSEPATVSASTWNTAPVAEAGADQAALLLGATVLLDGTASYDPDGDPLTYQWMLVSRPAASNATLAGASTAAPSFTIDVHGEYVVELLVGDAWVVGVPDRVKVSFDNLVPVANPGVGGSVNVGVAFTLDGRGSGDPNGDPITYAWAITSAPDASACTIAQPTAAVTSFVPDRAGTYVVQLLVSDGLASSPAASIQIQAVMTPSALAAEVAAIQRHVATLSAGSFKNPNMANALVNKLNAVLQTVAARNYAGALSQLEHDILAKTDGCATRSPPAPDKNDWVTTCSAQDLVYERLLLVIGDVLRLM